MSALMGTVLLGTPGAPMVRMEGAAIAASTALTWILMLTDLSELHVRTALPATPTRPTAAMKNVTLLRQDEWCVAGDSVEAMDGAVAIRGELSPSPQLPP